MFPKPPATFTKHQLFGVVFSEEPVVSIKNGMSPFVEEVNRCLSEGWELHGETTYDKSQSPGMVIIRQSILKTEYHPMEKSSNK